MSFPEEQDQTEPEIQNESEKSHDGECPDYGSAEYWDDRYSLVPQLFDWYQTWDDLMAIIGGYFHGNEIVINVGCGNSPMAVEMAETFHTVVNMDISSVVIDQMEEKFKDISNIIWFTMDCTDMPFDDETFDCAFDKGTIDALLCGPNSTEMVAMTLWEVHRTLIPGGYFFEITYGTPDTRVPLFTSMELDWTLLEPVEIQNPDRQDSVHYIYIFQKAIPGQSNEQGTNGPASEEEERDKGEAEADDKKE